LAAADAGGAAPPNSPKDKGRSGVGTPAVINNRCRGFVCAAGTEDTDDDDKLEGGKNDGKMLTISPVALGNWMREANSLIKSSDWPS
jgi:hypothetical protein